MFVFASYFKGPVFPLITGKLSWCSKISTFWIHFFPECFKKHLFLSCSKSVPTLAVPSASSMLYPCIFVTRLSPWKSVTRLSPWKKINQTKYPGQKCYSVSILCDSPYGRYSRINIPLFQNSISVLWVQVLLWSKMIFYSRIESTKEATLA